MEEQSMAVGNTIHGQPVNTQTLNLKTLTRHDDEHLGGLEQVMQLEHEG